MGLWGNLFAGLRLALFLPVDDDAFDARGRAVLFLWCALAIMLVVCEYLITRPVAGISTYGLTVNIADFFVAILALRLTALAVGLRDQLAAFEVRVLPSLLLATAFAYSSFLILPWIYQTWEDWALTAYYTVWVGALLLPAPAILRSVRRLPGGSVRRGLAAATVFTAASYAADTMLMDGLLFERDMSALEEAQEGLADGSSLTPEIAPDIEGAYYAQPALLETELSSIRPGVPGEVELFAIVAGLYPEERVFMREVEAVGDIVAERFGAEGRVVRLLNSKAEPERHPLANLRNIRSAAERIGAAMNPEDVLLVFLTSHGSPGVISTGYTFPMDEIYVSDVAEVLDTAGAGASVVVVSSCYSGSFVAGLEAPDRLIITASAADRTSFGCSDDREWTYFGEALFARALTETGDWRSAFDRARDLVTEWEEAEGKKPSQPQVSLGAGMGPALDALAEQHAGAFAAR
ncbi:MAG: C13 family peptidase [Pseudomonadota bacterium]